MEKAAWLYGILIRDPLPVPAICPQNSDVYPDGLCPGIHEDYWVEVVEKLQDRGIEMAFDRNDPTQLAELKTEIDTDPNGYGYASAGTEQEKADLINEKRAAITVSKPKISAALIRSTCTYEAWDGLLAPEQDWLRWITGSNGFEEENLTVTQDLRDRLTGALGGSTSGDSIWAAADDDAMEPAMLALIDIDGSRAEQLWGIYTTISEQDIIAARDS